MLLFPWLPHCRRCICVEPRHQYVAAVAASCATAPPPANYRFDHKEGLACGSGQRHRSGVSNTRTRTCAAARQEHDALRGRAFKASSTPSPPAPLAPGRAHRRAAPHATIVGFNCAFATGTGVNARVTHLFVRWHCAATVVTELAALLSGCLRYFQHCVSPLHSRTLPRPSLSPRSAPSAPSASAQPTIKRPPWCSVLSAAPAASAPQLAAVAPPALRRLGLRWLLLPATPPALSMRQLCSARQTWQSWRRRH